MSEEMNDALKEKFRPEADPSIEKEIDAALGGMSLDQLYDAAHQQQPVRQAPASATESDQPAPKNMRHGRIAKIGRDDVFVDLGGKSQGIAPLEQFDQVKIGDEFDFHVDRYDEREGLLILSRQGFMASNVSWETLEVGQIIEGMVSGMNKGGLEMTIKGMRAFMPSGQVDTVFHKDISIFLGQKLKVEVQQFDARKKNLIVSHRNIVEREEEEARLKMLAELAEGQVRRGRVRNVMDFGAFIDLGGMDGLLHISEMSHRRLKHPSELLKVGDMVDVKIIKLDKETKKLSLSLKQALADPWVDAAQRYPVGTTLTGRVARVEGFGAFVEAEEGVEGLLPVSEISYQRIRHPSDVMKEGETIKVVVLSIEPAAKRMTFSMKQAGPDPWAEVEGKFPQDSVVAGKVTRVVEFGAFVELEAGLEGLVHISEISKDRVRTAADAVKPGQDVKVRVLEIDKPKRRIALSIRRAEEPTPVPVAAPAPEISTSAKKKKRPELRGGLDFGGLASNK